jgi:translation initiation factor IF-3
VAPFCCPFKEVPTIARRRFFRPQENYNRGPNINERIRAREVRLVDENDQMVGVVDLAEAMARAYEAGLDLVEVAPDSSPPVCRILDFGKYKYELSKKEKATKAKSKTSDLKEVRLGRSLKIDPHDIQIRLNQARKFLLEGHKVQIVQNFRGREMMHRDRGNKRMQDVIETLDDVAKVELAPRMAGRRMTMILAPDKRKVDQYKKKMAQEKAAKDASDADAGPDKDADATVPADALESADAPNETPKAASKKKKKAIAKDAAGKESSSAAKNSKRGASQTQPTGEPVEANRD